MKAEVPEDQYNDYYPSLYLTLFLFFQHITRPFFHSYEYFSDNKKDNSD